MAQQPIQDFLIRDGQPITIDLAQAFGAGAHDFSVSSSDGAVIAASIVDGILTIDPGEFGHSDIRLSGTSADGLAIGDSFRARVAGENAYTIAVLPDTQHYTSDASISHIFGDMTQWLVDNRDSKGIQFVVGVGDVTNNNTAAQWQVAEEALRKLDGNIPYSLLPGNHDQANGGSAANHSTDFLDQLFSPDKQAATNPETFGGVYDREPDRGGNNYHTFTAPDGTKWLVLSLEFAPRDDVMRWAADVVEAHLDHQVILSTHNYMSFSGRSDEAPLYGGGPGADYNLATDPQGYKSGEVLWEEFVSKYPNMAMVFSGHIILGDGAETALGYTQHGNPVLQMLVNYQNGVSNEIVGGNGGNGAIRLITIDPDNDAVYTETYQVNLDDYIDGSRGQDEPTRDGLQGGYQEHEEVFTGIDFGTPALRAQADAGSDVFARAENGADTVEVTLDAGGSLNPDLASRYTWLDTDGRVVATGIGPTLTLGAGRHNLTLQVEDAEGRITSDAMLVVVSTDDTLLMDNFNDGKADGWSLPLPNSLAEGTRFGTTSELGLPAMPGGDAGVMAFAALPTKGQGYLVKPDIPPQSGGTINNYTIAFDVLIPSGQGVWFPFYQADPENRDDAELFVNTGRTNGGLGNGIGNSGRYFGHFTYNEWHRVVLTVTGADAPLPMLNIYLDGVKLGTVNYTSTLSNYRIDPDKGFLLFNDNTAGATSSGFLSSMLLTDKVLTDAEVAALGGAKAGGILAEPPAGGHAFQLDFAADAPLESSFGGNGGLALFDDTEASTGSWVVRGTHAAPGATPETSDGELYDVSDVAGQLLIWNDPAARGWRDYSFEVTARSTDDDEIGVVFYYENEKNHYRFETYLDGNYRRLIKVEDGQRTVLAEVAKGYVFDTDIDLKIAVSEGRIEIFMDGRTVFGPVIDETPLPGGTIGVYSSYQNGTSFDNVLVSRIVLTAHGEGSFRAIDMDGDGAASVTLNAGSSYGLADLVNFSWQLDGEEIASGRNVTVDLPIGTEGVTLVVTDATGATSSDFVKTDLVAKPSILVSDGFGEDTLAGGAWRIIDQDGSIGSSDWRVQNGRLEQLSNIYSEQLTRDGNGVWGQGWSPLGDGVNVLRKGTIALYAGQAAASWTDYSIEAAIRTPAGADANGLGFVFHYLDERNYYKLELDSVGRMWNLALVKDGIEELLDRVPGRYAPGSTLQLRLDVRDHKIQAYIDGEAVFPAPVEDRELSGGSFGLYAWKSPGVSFDDVTVVSLVETPPSGGPILGTSGDDELVGTAGDDAIVAGSGDDIVLAGAGNDSVDGGVGDDVLDGGDGNDRLKGGESDDELIGGAGDDLLAGGADDDVLDGGEGTDTADYSDDTAGVVVDLSAGTAEGDEAGSDELVSIENVIGGAGDDVFTGDTGNNAFTGGAGRDTLVLAAATGAITLDLAAGTVEAEGLGHDSFSSIEAFVLSDGDDRLVLIAGSEAISIDGGAGHDTLVLTGNGTLGEVSNIETVEVEGNWTLIDEGFDIALQDGAQTLTLAASELADGNFAGTISGFAQEDRIVLSGLAATTAALGAGNLLTLTGGANGPVTLQLDPAQDFAGMSFTLASDGNGGVVLSYGPANGGDDVLIGGNGDDILDGGAGNDIIKGGAGDDTLKGGAGDDQIDGGSGDDALYGGTGNDTIKGGSGDDLIDGGEGDDVIDAGSDDDIVFGGAGNDVIDGGSGDDRINGGAGDDILTGGSGHDVFVFAAGFGKDIITDFRTSGSSSDVLEFGTDVFANYDAAMAAATQVGTDAVFAIDADTSFTLKGVQLTSLAHDDFRFA